MFSLINLTRHFQFNEGQTSGYGSKNKNGGHDRAVEPAMGGELTGWNFWTQYFLIEVSSSAHFLPIKKRS